MPRIGEPGLLKLARELAERYQAFGNPVRILILLILYKKGESSWNTIMEEIEKYLGRTNPNTLAFHLKKLIEAGIVYKKMTGDEVKYVIKNNEIVRELLGDIIGKASETGGYIDI